MTDTTNTDDQVEPGNRNAKPNDAKETQPTVMEPVGQVGLVMGGKNYVLSAEEAWDEINHDRLETNVDTLRNNNYVDTNGYAMMAMAVDQHETPPSDNDEPSNIIGALVKSDCNKCHKCFKWMVDHSDDDLLGSSNNDTDNDGDMHGGEPDSDDTDDDDSNPDKEDQRVGHSESLLDHAIYCAACAGRATLQKAEGWYEVVCHKLHIVGIQDSSVYCDILDR